MVCMVLIAHAAFGEEKQSLATQKEKMSYAAGLEIGDNLKKKSIDVDPEILLKGIKDALSGGKPLMTEQELKEVVQLMQKDLQEKKKILGEKNRKDGDSFLAENKKKQGVKTLPSGLQYKVVTEGAGGYPTATDRVKVNYRGKLIDGTEFDSSYKRGEPAIFPTNGVIKGLTEALQLMKQGSTWQLFIPSELAYGDQGTPDGRIGPNAALIFEVELILVNPLTRKSKHAAD